MFVRLVHYVSYKRVFLDTQHYWYEYNNDDKKEIS